MHVTQVALGQGGRGSVMKMSKFFRVDILGPPGKSSIFELQLQPSTSEPGIATRWRLSNSETEAFNGHPGSKRCRVSRRFKQGQDLYAERQRSGP